MYLLHGEAGGLDELIIALVAFGVLWLAVKLAGRKPVDEDADAEEAAEPGAHKIDQPAPRP
jgi:hypothetical protein